MGHPGEGRGEPRSGPTIRNARWAVLVWAALAGSSAAGGQVLATGSIEGKLTDLYSKPLNGVSLVLRNSASGAEFTAVTGEKGVYRLAGLAPGEYVLEAHRGKLAEGRISGIIVTAGHAARVQTAIALHAPLPGLTPPTDIPAEQTARVHPDPRLIPRPTPRPDPRWDPASDPHPHPPPLDDSAAISSPSAIAAATHATGTPPRASVRTATVAAMVGPGISLGTLAGKSMQAARLSALAVPDTRDMNPSDEDPTEARGVSISGEEYEALPQSQLSGRVAPLGAPPELFKATNDTEGETGRRGDRAGITVDGIDIRLAFGGRGATPGAAALLGPAGSQAAIREMRVLDREIAAAELSYGGIAGVRMRGGGDAAGARLHGQVFVFDRSNLFGALNPFTDWIKETAPATAGSVPTFAPFAWSPGDRAVRWGASGGGPLRSRHLFWYAALEQDEHTSPAVAAVKHPDRFFAQPRDDEMQVLSARLRLSSADPVAEGIAAYSGMLETLGGLLGPTSRSSSRWTSFGRIDWNATERHRFVLEGTGSRWDAPGGGLTRISETHGSHSFGASRSRESWVITRWDAFLTPKLTAVTQAALGHYTLAHPAQEPSAFEQTLDVNPWQQLPQMIVDSRYGFTIGNPARFGAGTYPDEHAYQARETLDWTRGALEARLGFEAHHNADSTSFVRNHTGTYHYARVENFASDALVFAKYGLSDPLDPLEQHNCDQRGKAWSDADGQLHGLGYLPCYSYYTQTLGPTDWHLETTDWAAFSTALWRPAKALALSAGLRWDRQEIPPPIALVDNPALPLTQQLPTLGNEWAPRLGLAWGTRESHWPVLRIGYGMYYGRTPNRTLQAALTQTGSLNGDVNLLLRPTDNLPGKSGGAPPFPYVLAGTPGTIVHPGAVEISPTFRNAQAHQAIASAEKELPGRVLLTASALAALGRDLPVTMDTNFDPVTNPGTITYSVVDPTGKGPIKTPQLTVPFFASWPSPAGNDGRLNPDYRDVAEMFSRANSTYEAAMLQVSRSGRRGLSFHARYAYGHAMDWNPSEGGLTSTGSNILDPLDFRQEYGNSDMDVRHSFSVYSVWQSPWRLRGTAAPFANGWMLSGIGQFHSGLPFTMRTAGSIPQQYEDGGGFVVGLGPGMNGYGGDNRLYGVGRNTYRYPATWKADLRLGKRFSLGRERELQLMAESFNLFNHQNVTDIETIGYYIDSGGASGALPTLNFLTGTGAGQIEFGQPLNINATDSYRERQFDFGMRLRFKHPLEP